MLKIIAQLALPFLLLAIHSGGVAAQQATPLHLNLGDAVVTGFSGTLTAAARKAHAGDRDAIDRTFIDPDGPSARVFGLGKPGFAWDGRLFAAPNPFEVRAKDVGQVFGIALDNATPPNIYLAATSAYGLNIIRRGRDGLPERRKNGGPGVGWMKGQFGLDLQGGPGAIYKVDGHTGAVSLFASVTLDGVPNPGPALGNLAYDSAHKQLFVSDLYTGMIHRFALDGRELGQPYDHGVIGRPTHGNVPAQAFNPRARPNIATARFNSEDPDTWGLAPPPRRVWALAVHDGRLFYSARNGASGEGPQIWSIGIASDGDFASDPRWELDVPAKPRPYAVSDIAFSQRGAMILAQRAAVAGAYDYGAFTQAGEPRVLRFWLKDPNDPPSPGRWKPAPEEYAIGLAGDYRNSNGGVALGYGYDNNGMLQTGSCEAALWSTGQNLRNNLAMRSQLDPGGPLLVNGMQGSPADMVRSANTPPMLSYFIDYDGKFDDARAAGHIGGIRILTQPCTGSAIARIAPPAIATLIDKRPRACTPTCVCPPGTVPDGKDCVKPHPCPDGQVYNPQTKECGCRPHYRLIDGVCKPEILIAPQNSCKPPQVLDPLTQHCICPKPLLPGELPGTCKCPDGSAPVGGKCGPPPKCDPPQVLNPKTGLCECPHGGALENGRCVPQVCPPPMVPGPCVGGTPIDLGIEKTGGTSPPPNVPWYGFHIMVTNHGPGSAPAGSITVTDVVPTGMTFTNVAGTGWTCMPSSGGPGTHITCTYGPATNAGDVLPAINVTAQAMGDGPFPPFTNCAVVAPAPGSDLTDTDASDDQACVTVSKPGKTGDLTVKKIVQSRSPLTLPPMTFPVDANCGGTVTHMNLPNGGSQTVGNIAVPGSCTVNEGSFVTPPNACPPNTTPTWTTNYSPPSPVNITGPGAVETITNVLICRETKTCPPPQVLNTDGICVCPPPMVPGAAPGTCACPDGEVLVNGKCVKPIVCKTPLVPNAQNTDCVCPDHEVLRRGKCVKVEEPKQHTCKRGYYWNGDMCVRRHFEQREERHELPHRLPGGTSPFGGGGGGGAGKR